MMVDTSRNADEFDKLVGNKDFRPVLKLLLGRQHLLRALQDTALPEWDDKASMWGDCGSVLEAFIGLVCCVAARVWMTVGRLSCWRVSLCGALLRLHPLSGKFK
jgi:hypothetical protein